MKLHHNKRAATILFVCLLSASSLVACNQERIASQPTQSSKNESSNQVNLSESVIPPNSLFSPTFETKEAVYSAGTAFALKLPQEKRPLLITATHLFGEAGGLLREVPSSELPTFVLSVGLQDLFDPNASTFPLEAKVLALPGATSEDLSKDLAAFLISENTKIPTYELEIKPPMVDEPIWLAASVAGGAPAEQKLHKAIVKESDSETLCFQFENPDLDLTATSGAPILNKDGKVVGINIAGEEIDGKILGYGNSAASIEELLKKGLLELK